MFCPCQSSDPIFTGIAYSSSEGRSAPGGFYGASDGYDGREVVRRLFQLSQVDNRSGSQAKGWYAKNVAWQEAQNLSNSLQL